MRQSDQSDSQKDEFGFCSNTDFTGEGKILKGFHMCYNFSARKGGRKSPVSFFLKELVL